MEYESFKITSKSQIKSLLESNNRDLKIEAIIGMINGIEDELWVQNVLLKMINESDFWIAKNAISGLADIVRIHSDIDVSLIVSNLLSISDNRLEVIVKEAISDINVWQMQNKK